MRGKGRATKDGNGWHVEFSEDFMRELKCAPIEVQEEVNSLIRGIKDGTIDPMTMGKRMCCYCGNELVNAPEGVSSCQGCLEELR